MGKQKKYYSVYMVLLFVVLHAVWPFHGALAHHMMAKSTDDGDLDGLTLAEEAAFGTDPQSSDSDNDGYLDGDEVSHGYDPRAGSGARLKKRIIVDISEQWLSYSFGEFGLQGSMLISSARKGFRTPEGTYVVQIKKPLVNYRGRDYNYPKTKWNLQFLPSYYIHGAWWHNNFGQPMSHGCVNVPYPAMEKLYAFADEGTEIVIKP